MPVQVSSLTGVSAVAAGGSFSVALSGSVAVGAPYTNTRDVTLTLSASDAAGISQMKFMTDGTNWTTPEAYATTKALSPFGRWHKNSLGHVQRQCWELVKHVHGKHNA